MTSHVLIYLKCFESWHNKTTFDLERNLKQFVKILQTVETNFCSAWFNFLVRKYQNFCPLIIFWDKNILTNFFWPKIMQAERRHSNWTNKFKASTTSFLRAAILIFSSFGLPKVQWDLPGTTRNQTPYLSYTSTTNYLYS